VLGSVLQQKRIVIDSKACVGKTYPLFWDHCQSLLGLQLYGVLMTC